jgi:hypothetical protein
MKIKSKWKEMSPSNTRNLFPPPTNIRRIIRILRGVNKVLHLRSLEGYHFLRTRKGRIDLEVYTIYFCTERYPQRARSARISVHQPQVKIVTVMMPGKPILPYL